MISTTIPHLVLLPLLLASAGGAVLWIAALVSVLRTAAAWRALVWVVLTLVFPVVGRPEDEVHDLEAPRSSGR